MEERRMEGREGEPVASLSVRFNMAAVSRNRVITICRIQRQPQHLNYTEADS